MLIEFIVIHTSDQSV